MKRIWILAMVVLMCAALGVAQDDMSKMKGDKKMSGGDVSSNLKDIENKWAAASAKGDCDTIAAMLSDTWVNTQTDGKLMTKSEWLNDCKKTKISQSELSDMKVNVVNSNTAVVTGKWKGSGTGADGKDVGGPEQWTDVFVKEGGKWKVVASQATKISGEQSQSAQQ